ncbi:MAG: DUF4412 domain-containing protein [Planctomycetes bacterium]|nr:DUF4412 domain-containing protein [Planctomycetota bacterium]
MKERNRVRGWLVMGFVVLVCGAVAAEDFYYEATMQTSGIQGMPTMTLMQKVWMSKGKMKVEMTGGPMPMKVFIRTDLRKMYMVNEMQHSYMEMPLSQMIGMAGNTAQGVQVNVQKTEETRQIGKWNCRKYVITATGPMPMKVTSWVAPGIEVDKKMMEEMQKVMGSNPAMKALAEKTKEIKGFPIEQIVEMNMGGQQMTTKMTVTKIQQGPIPASTFDLPAGYQKMQMPAMPPGGAPQGGGRK